jgi:hypothetical protein
MQLAQIENVFRDLYAGNRRARYEIKVTSAALDYCKIYVDLTLLADEKYCCSEPGCHLPWNCKKLFAITLSQGLNVPDDVTVYWHGIVQQGARLDVLKKLGLPAGTSGHEWDAVLTQNGLKIL